MKKIRLIATSVLTITLCLSLIVGATFALFTSESKTNVAVVSGKVEVEATVENLVTFSNDIEQATGTFELGGTALVTDNTLTLNKMMPMDKATFEIKVVNHSNVTIKYRTRIMALEDDGLFSGLIVKVDDLLYQGETIVTPWTTSTQAGELALIDVSIELPESAGNEYQDKSTKLVYVVEAVQGNAEVSDQVSTTAYVYTKYDFQALQTKISDPQYTRIEILEDIDMSGVSYISPRLQDKSLVIEGNNHTIYNFKPSTSSGSNPGTGLIGSADLRFQLEIKNIKFEDINFVGTTQAGLVGFIEAVSSSVKFTNIEMTGGSISASKYVGGIYGYATASGAMLSPIEITNVHLTDLELVGQEASVGGFAGHVNASSHTQVILKDSTLTNVEARSLESHKVGKAFGTLHVGTLNVENTKVDDINILITPNFYGRYLPSTTGVVIIDGNTLVQDGYYTKDNFINITTASGLKHASDLMATSNNSTFQGKTLRLLTNIDFTGYIWTSVRQASVRMDNFTFDGQNFTISNFTTSGHAMFYNMTSDNNIIKNIKFDNVNIVKNEINVALIAVQVYSDVLIENLEITNSYFEGKYKVAPVVGTVYNENDESTNTLTLKNITVTDTTVKSTEYAFMISGLVAFVHDEDADELILEDITLTNIVIDIRNMPVSNNYPAFIYLKDSESPINQHEEVIVTNVTILKVLNKGS